MAYAFRTIPVNLNLHDTPREDIYFHISCFSFSECWHISNQWVNPSDAPRRWHGLPTLGNHPQPSVTWLTSLGNAEHNPFLPNTTFSSQNPANVDISIIQLNLCWIFFSILSLSPMKLIVQQMKVEMKDYRKDSWNSIFIFEYIPMKKHEKCGDFYIGNYISPKFLYPFKAFLMSSLGLTNVHL